MALSVKAQFQYDAALPLPTVDLYDSGAMNMYLNALAQTAPRREARYHEYCDMAYEALDNHQWSYVISYVNQALGTGFYCGSIYYVRGYAYESLGNYKAAKRDYKIGKKYNSVEAAQALDALKIRIKQNRRR